MLKSKLSALFAFSIATTVVAQFGGGNEGNKISGGTGPYTAYYFEDATLPNHTIYQPKDPAGLKLPVIAWANGACAQNGTAFAPFLAEVASHGAMAIAVGPIEGIPESGDGGGGGGVLGSHPERQRAAIDWAIENAGRGNYSHVDASRIAVWGMSCGGIESYANWNDSRVNSIGIFNSGSLSPNGSESTAAEITKPIFYFLGGPSDIAYENGERDYSILPAGTPSWIGNDDLGHGGAFDLPNAGYYGTAGVKYMQWLLRGNTSAGTWFTDGSALEAGFVDQKFKNLHEIEVTPIEQNEY